MPYSINHQPEQSLLEVTFTGDVDGAQIIAADNQIITSYRDMKYQLWDYTKISTIYVTPKEIHELAMSASRVSAKTSVLKTAIVGDRALVTGSAHTFKLFSEAWVGQEKTFEIELFTSLTEAMSWLTADKDSESK